MVGLSDIPCVGVALQRISEAAVDAGTRGLRYSLCYNTLVNQLNSEIENLNIQEDKVSRKVDAARNDGKMIEDDVEKWQEDVKKVKSTVANELSGQITSRTCFKVLRFPNLVSRFRLGRKAAHQSKKVAELTVSGRDIVAKEVGYLQPVENVPISNTTYHSFASRQEAYGKLWEALVDQNSDPVLGIYGMPGVGKTRMMKQACKDAMDKNIFDKVARVNVGGEKLNVINLQDKLADSLDCNLQSKHNEMQRASQLKSSLTNGNKKILIILDDVWNVIPLKSVGIPFGDGTSKGCKILLTSRNQDECRRNKCKDPIELKTLTDSEAWEMFQNTVGTSTIEPLKDALLAEKVCKKCAALPLLIHAVGNALKCATENLWKDALYQLENHKFEAIEGIEPKVHACLQLSFEKLNVEARSCLLLCSLFPEDDDIKIKMLFDLATGSQLLDRRRNIDALIDILISSSLLGKGENDDTVKLHDIIRDVARSIATRDPKYAFSSVTCSWRLPDNVDYHSLRLLKLDLQEDNVRFPNDLVCPDLHTLWLQGNNKSQQLSSGFFERFTNIRFLLLQGMTFPDHQQLSINKLEKLRVLCISYCKIPESFFSSISKEIEILCISDCYLPIKLELVELKNLRKLELLNNFEFYMGKAISSLSNLEELTIVGGFEIWGDAEADGTSIFAQLSQLTWFRNLTIDLQHSRYCPDQVIVNKLVEFDIYVGPQKYHRSLRDSSKKSIRLEEIDDIENGWMTLVERAEKVELTSVEGLAHGFSDSNTSEAFKNLMELKIQRCYEMKHLASWDGRNQPLTCFGNLSSVYIYDCRELQYLFSSSVAKCLRQMQKLQVVDCPAIEEIVRVDEGRSDQGEIKCFPKLKQLHLEDLPSLKNFSSHKVEFTSLEVSGLDNASETPRKVIYHKDDYSFSQLKFLKVRNCDEMEYAIPVTNLHECKNLQELSINGCRSLKTVFQHSSTTNLQEISNGRVEFTALKEIYMLDLPKLESLWTTYDHQSVGVNSDQRGSYNYFIPKVTFPNIEKMTMWELNSCILTEKIELGRDDSPPKLNTLSLYSFDQEVKLPSQWLLQLNNIEILQLQNCWWTGDSLFNGIRNFQRLRLLEIEKCGINSLFTYASLTFLQQLESLTVSECPLLEEIVWGDVPHGSNDMTTISLPRLESVVLKNLPKLKNGGIFSCYMPVLNEVEVEECGLSTLFTSSAFKYLPKLSSLEVSDCPLLEYIVEDEMHDETPKKTISLLCLTRLHLKCLSSLKSFSGSSVYAFNMPALHDVSLYGCPSMHTFTLLEVSIPGVDIYSPHSYHWDISDLNRFVAEEVYGREFDDTGDDENDSEQEDNNSTTDKASNGESSANNL